MVSHSPGLRFHRPEAIYHILLVPTEAFASTCEMRGTSGDLCEVGEGHSRWQGRSGRGPKKWTIAACDDFLGTVIVQTHSDRPFRCWAHTCCF